MPALSLRSYQIVLTRDVSSMKMGKAIAKLMTHFLALSVEGNYVVLTTRTHVCVMNTFAPNVVIAMVTPGMTVKATVGMWKTTSARLIRTLPLMRFVMMVSTMIVIPPHLMGLAVFLLQRRRRRLAQLRPLVEVPANRVLQVVAPACIVMPVREPVVLTLPMAVMTLKRIGAGAVVG